MELNQKAKLVFENKLWTIKNQFLISIDNYRQVLKEQYLEGSKTTSDVQTSQNQLNDVYAKTFLLSSQINSNIIKNNKSIQSLDEYLDMLKAKVDAENNLLQQTVDTQKAAIPREEIIRKMSRENYILSTYYVISVLGASIVMYRSF